MSPSLVSEVRRRSHLPPTPQASTSDAEIAANLLLTQQLLLSGVQGIYDFVTLKVEFASIDAVVNIRHLRVQLDQLQSQLTTIHRLWHRTYQMPQVLCAASKAVISSLRPATFCKFDGHNELCMSLGPCAICQEEYQPRDMVVQAPSCGHMFHHACLLEAYKTSNRCAICRYEVDTVDEEYNRVLRLRAKRQQYLAIQQSAPG